MCLGYIGCKGNIRLRDTQGIINGGFGVIVFHHIKLGQVICPIVSLKVNICCVHIDVLI